VGVRGGKLKRFVQAISLAALLSWTFLAYPGGHGGGGGMKILPTVIMVPQLIAYQLKHDSLRIEFLTAISFPILTFSLTFAAFWWFSRWRTGETDYFGR
jgi:hypothetical protein